VQKNETPNAVPPSGVQIRVILPQSGRTAPFHQALICER
jgi:hypothetical protein